MSPMSSWYPPSRPRRVEGGIRARSRRGEIAQSWWSARFLRGLEESGVGGRLARGRAYARAGQVLELSVDVGSVVALVQGSRARPYRVRVGVPTFGKAGWTAVERALAEDAWFAAKLLAGEMPADIEDVFAAAGLRLFPDGVDELAMDCSCPDHSVPCKHLAATLFLLAESFDTDPFGILLLRGRERAELLGRVRAHRDRAGRTDGTVADGLAMAAPTAPLADCLDTFFHAPPRPAVPPPAPAPADALLDQLPDPGITVRGRAVTELLRPLYRSLGPG
ncbi:MAG: SWIM zinc finger family protein [Pseudonocardia sp.]